MSSKTNGNRKRGRPRGRRNRKKRTPLALKQHDFVERLAVNSTITVNTEAASTCVTRTFALNQIGQWNSYSDLFEYYKINKIVATFRYKGGNAPPPSDAVGIRFNEVNPVLYFKVDHDDDTAQSMVTMKESSKTREHQLTNDKPNFTITFKPAVQTEIYKTSLASAYGPKWGVWLRTTDNNVPHYALKMHAIAYKDANFNPADVVVSYKMYISFKNNE